MAEKKKTETKKIEREFVIPLREKCRSVPRYKKTPKAVKTVKEFLARHMKVADRDLNKVKLDRYLNQALWFRGIKKPIHKIKVKAIREGDIVRVYAVDLPSSLNFKKIREEKKAEEQKKIGEKAKKEIEAQKKEQEEAEKAEEDKDKDKDGIDDKKEEKEKTESVKETDQKEMKEEAKVAKKTPKKKTAEQKGKEAERSKE